MNKHLACPACGCTRFTQDRTTSYDEIVMACFSPNGEVKDEQIEEQECSGEEASDPYRCRDCGWEFVDENGEPISEPKEVVAKFEQTPGGSDQHDDYDPGWIPLGSVTIDTARLLLLDPIHQGRVDAEAKDGQIAVHGGDYTAVQVPTGIGDGRYRVEGRVLNSPIFGQRLAEIRVRFLDEHGNWLGADPQQPQQTKK